MKLEIQTQRNILLVLALILCAAIISLAVSYYRVNTQAVASVNGEKIKKEELYQYMLKQDGQSALESLISKKVVEIEADKQNIMVSDEDIQKELEHYYEYYGGEEAFNQALASSGYSNADMYSDLDVTVKIKKLLEPRILISEDEMKAYFEENQATFAQEKQVKASHILADTEEEAKQIETRLANGEEFAQLAKEYSKDSSTADNGGELGFFKRGDMVKEFEDAAFGMKVGDISAPVKTDYGYHIIKIDEIQEAQQPDYEQSKDKVKNTIFEQKAQTEYDSWLQEMYQQYDIQRLIPEK